MINIKPILEEVNGSTFISIDTETQVKLSGGKKNVFQNRVTKVSEGHNVMVFQNKNKNGYEEMVKRRMEKEGLNLNDFHLKPRSWGVRLNNTPIVEHKGKFYLEVIFLHKGKVHYCVDGVETDKSQIDGMIGSKPESEQGGLMDKVIIRTFSLESLKSITINGQTYKGTFTYQ